MAEESLKNKTAKGLFWGGVSNGVQQLLGVVIGIVLLKNLTPDDYAMVGMLAIFTGIATIIQESGFTAALTNRAIFKHQDYNAVFWFNLIVSSIIYIALFFLAPFIADFFRQPDLIPLARFLFLSFWAGSLGIAHNAVLFKKMMAKQRAKIDIISTLISGVVGIYMALQQYGYWALAVQTVMYSLMGTLLRWLFSPWHPNFNIIFSPIKEMFGFSVKLLISNVISVIQNNIFSILLGRFYTKTILGYYSQGAKWGSMGGQVLYGMIYNVTQPMIVEVQDSRERQLQVFRKLMRYISFVSCPLLLGLAFIAKEFIEIVNSEFLPCVPIMQIYCAIALINAFQYLYTQTCISLGRSDLYGYITVFYAIIQITVSCLVFSYGIYWLAFIILVLNVIYLFVWHYYLNKELSLKWIYFLRDIFPYFLLTIVTFLIVGILTFKIQNVYVLLLSKVLISTLIYVLLLWISNSVLFRESCRFILKK